MSFITKAATLILVVVTHAHATIPPMPKLDQAIADEAIVVRNDLKALNVEIELRLIIDAYMRLENLTEEQVREKHADQLSYVGYIAGGSFNRAHYDALYENAKLDDPDPQYRFFKNFKSLNTDERNPVKINTLRLCVLEMEEKDYSQWRIAGAALSYRDKAAKLLDKEDSTDEIDRFVIQRIANVAAQTPMTSSTRWRLWESFITEFINSKKESQRNIVLDVFENTQDMDPWVLAMVRGECERKTAWQIRGGGYSYTVDADEFRGFNKHLDLSMQWFRQAYKLDPMCPSGPAYMLQALYPNGSLWEAEGYTWVERTLVACVDYPEVFDTLRHILQLRWHGDWESHKEVALWANKPELYHTMLPYQSVRFLDKVLWNYGVKRGDIQAFWDEESELIDSVMESLQGMLDNGAPISKDYAHTHLAYLNYRHKGDIEAAAHHIRACKNGFNSGARATLDWDDVRLESLVIPFVGPTADIARSAKRHQDNKNYRLATERWNKVLEVFESMQDEIGMRCTREILQHIQWLEAYETGDWVNLEFDEHMSGWWTHEGIWERVDQNTVQAKQDGTEKETLLIADIDPGDSFEYTANVSFEGKPPYYSTLAIFYYRGHRVTDGYDMMRSLSARLVYREEGSMGWGFARTDYHTPIEIPDDYTFKLRVIVEGDQVTGYINGQQIGKGDVPNYKPEKEPEDYRLAIGAWAPGLSGHAVFTNIRVRKFRQSDSLDF